MTEAVGMIYVMTLNVNVVSLCARDEDVHFALNRFTLIKFDETTYQSNSRLHHGLAVYIKENFEIQKILKHRSLSSEFVMVALQSLVKGFYQYVIHSKYPNRSQADLKKDMQSRLRPVVDLTSNLVILRYFNIQVNKSSSHFVEFMERCFIVYSSLSKLQLMVDQFWI